MAQYTVCVCVPLVWFANPFVEHCLPCLTPWQVMEVINEEERQFLRTLSQGKRHFERTVNQLPGETLPGEEEGVECATSILNI